MSAKGISVFGIYPTRAGVENAVTALCAADYDNSNFSVLYPFNKDAAHDKDARSPEGPTVGVESGAVTGGVLGSIVGIRLLGIPGVGPFLAAGPVVAALSFAGAASAFGGIAGGLIAMGISDVDAKKYEGQIRKNGILLAIHDLSAISSTQAGEILLSTGAEDITFNSGAEETSAAIPVNLGMALLNAEIVNDKSPSALHENSQRPPSTKAIKTAELQNAAEYISPSQPLGAPSTVLK